ncbi:hypothetical protein H2198_007676 [Neophaeococcomyces mojaviensis]|uniref:Uncharacterized protein n=1 Tax=Neophaeococcomyces mojaviensis TaxID=3383035 RepID=A0ACC2ZZA5_9EURO|nr:hypothetical protein H2198_007676 [Knufia sp. JES_112]
MSQPNIEDEAGKKSYTKPYGGKHPIPTIKGYRQHRKELDEQYGRTEDLQDEQEDDDSKTKRAYDSAKTILKGEDEQHPHREPYPASNHNDQQRAVQQDVQHKSTSANNENDEQGNGAAEGTAGNAGSKQQDKSATEQAASAIDPREKRKAMKKTNRGGGREVTDPVTHLPIYIHDQTEKDLDSMPQNEPVPGSHHRTATGLSGASKGQTQLDSEQEEIQRSHRGLQKTFPPPAFKEVEQELASVYKLAMTVGLGTISLLALFALVSLSLVYAGTHSKTPRFILIGITLSLTLVTAGLVVFGVRGWLNKKVSEIWNDETWDALRQEEKSHLDDEAELPESVQWLNSLMTSIWPLVNPDLFTSLVDTLEDVMQASLPKVVRMVSVDDMGQGTEALRILGIKWLPTGAASQSVDEHGNLKTPDEKAESDRTAPGEGEQDHSADAGNEPTQDKNKDAADTQKKQEEQEQQAMRAGMEAEEGDFVNMELAFAYRARTSGKSIKTKAKNAHLYLKFYLPGGIAIPVWVELQGIMGIMRLRLQLTPDPPFFSICTLTFLGQPKADLSCVPLSKHNLNLMDVPLISSFVQSAIDAALAEYVAPKSLTLDLKDMLVGEDFKKDTVTRGVVWIFIKQARGFKQGDGGIGPLQGASDAYVTVSWGKFGKPVASTRVITDEQSPNWHEWTSILVSSDELNAQERLRLQLWDSDKWTADDDLGRVELDLKELMHSPETRNKMCDREDRFKGEDIEENMPGTLTWSVGFFEKTRITDVQFAKQTYNEDVRSKEELSKMVNELSERKLREAKSHGYDKEINQQKIQDYREQEENMIISAPPSRDHLSGILSIQIHNITGLEIQNLQKKQDDDQNDDREEEAEQGSNVPDSYCTIILNHRKIYKTRTKPKNAKPFFNASTERFVKDWSTAEVIISVRDSREKEDDALLGVIYLPLKHVFAKRAQIMENFPLAGGIGYGRARISLVWRSVEMQLPANLRGWDYGTLEIKGAVQVKGHLEESLKQHRIKLRTNLSKTKMHGSDGKWQSKRNDSVFLAVRQRYASALIIEFRTSTFGPDKTPAFAVLWLSELVDEEDQTKTLTVWKGGKKNLQRAEACCDYNGLEEDEQSLGQIELTMKFWQGLSGYHKSHAAKSKNDDVRNVMECLDTINDENMDDMYSDDADSEDSGDNTETDESYPNSPARNRNVAKTNGKEDDSDAETRKKLKVHTSQTSGDCSSDGDSDVESNESSGFAKVKAPLNKIQEVASTAIDRVSGDHDNQHDSSRGARAQVKDYKDHHKQMHRKHRGIMQWKSARTLDWAGGKAKRAKSRIGGLFEHGSKDQGIETEV